MSKESSVIYDYGNNRCNDIICDVIDKSENKNLLAVCGNRACDNFKNAIITGQNNIMNQQMDEDYNSGNPFNTLTRLIETSKEKVQYFCTGTLSNIATLMLSAPHLKDKIKEIVLCLGKAGKYPRYFCSEENIYEDPHAAHIIFSSGIPIATIQWELACKIGKSYMDLLPDDLKDCMDEFLMSLYVLNEDRFQTKRVNCMIDLDGAFSFGSVMFDYLDIIKNDKNVTLIEEIENSDLMLKEIIKYGAR